MELYILFEIISDTSLGVWLGSIVFFSFIGAPKIFHVLEEEKAGEVVNNIFPNYYFLGIIAGTIAAIASLARIYLEFRIYTLITFIGCIISIILFIYSRQNLIPKMEKFKEKRFEKIHKLSVRINSIALVSVIISIISSQI